MQRSLQHRISWWIIRTPFRFLVEESEEYEAHLLLPDMGLYPFLWDAKVPCHTEECCHIKRDH